MKGRKRHLVVDTLGLVLALCVLPADQSDPSGAERLLPRLVERFPRLAKLWADSSYQGLVAWAAALAGWVLEIVRRAVDQVGFVTQPHRWIVERTFAWLGDYHRLGRDYERLPEMVAGLHFIVFAILMLVKAAPLLNSS